MGHQEKSPPVELAASPTADPSWSLVEEGFDLAREHELESLLALSNGYIGSRASLAEGSSMSAPATFLAGVYDVAGDGAVPELAAAPDWMQLRGFIAGVALSAEQGGLLDQRRILDLGQGILFRQSRFEDACGRVTHVRGFRLVSLADRHLLLQSMLVTPVNYSAPGRIEAVLAPPPPRSGYLEMLPAGARRPREGGCATLELRTRTGIHAAFAAAGRLRPLGGLAHPGRAEATSADGGCWDIELTVGKSYVLERIIAVYTSRDTADPLAAATEHLRATFERGGARALVAEHVAAWRRRWALSGVEIEGDDDAQRAVRVACYHLIGAANPDDERVSIGARALTGPAYKGHVFWDTEIYMLPFYTLTHPASARALLMYRFHTLPSARDKARRMGFRGALYAWESADSGAETTPPAVVLPNGEVVPVLAGEQEHHISADVAHAVWQYWQTTGDDAFFTAAGAEMVLETARFWASRVERGEDGLYHIRRVVGPDEYHEGVDDDAFTNNMARWNLERGLETAQLLAVRWPKRHEELTARLGLGDEELQHWERVAAAIYTGLDTQTGLFEQCRGFFALERIDLDAHAERRVPMDMVLGRARTQASQVVKQADVVLLIWLLWDRFPPAVREACFRYYDPITAHGSSLSPAIHALVAARLGLEDAAMKYFRQAAEIDLGNNMGNAAGGVHAAALGGLWQAVLFGFAGLRLGPDLLTVDPKLPASWRALRFSVQLGGRRVRFDLHHGEVSAEVEAPTGAAPLRVGVGQADPAQVDPGARVRWRLRGGQYEEVKS